MGVFDTIEQEQTQTKNVFDEAVDTQPVNDPVLDQQRGASVWDMAAESNIPLNESEALHNELSTVPDAPKDGLLKRFGKQLYNSAIANTLTALRTKSEVGKIGESTKSLDILEQDFRLRAESGEGVTEDEIKFYTEPYKKGSVGSVFGFKQKDWALKIREDYNSGKLKIIPKRTPEEESERALIVSAEAERQHFVESDVSAAVSEPVFFGENAIDGIAGAIGYGLQVSALRKFAPSMGNTLAMELVSEANGATPGHGAAMGIAMGGIGKMIPGSGVLPATERAFSASALFGGTTYIGGGDTEDVIVAMGIPFFFEGVGVGKQAWANYKNKTDFFKIIRKKAPALRDRSDIEIDAAIAKTLGNIEPTGRTGEQMKGEFATKQAGQEISQEVKAYQQAKRYSELLEKANSGDKKATKELNDFVQKTSLPTYDELLEKGYNGDQKAFEQIQEGNYYGGSAMKPELKAATPPTKAAKAVSGEEPTLGMGKAGSKPTPVQRPATPIEQMKDAAKVKDIDINTPVSEIDPAELSKARERGFITSVKEVLPELKIEGQYIPRSTDTLAIKARNLIVDDINMAEQVARKGTDQNAVATASELIKHYGDMAAKAKTQAAKEAAYDKAADVAQDMAAKLTELGRAVQAASILGRLTPEGQVRFAAREIQKYNEKVEKGKGADKFRKKIPELTKEQARKIFEEMNEIAKMPNGKEKFIRFQKVQDYISKLVPTPMMDKIATLWKAGLLTGLKTSGLNILSNTAHTATEVIKDVPATAVDKIVGYFTGKRTVTPTIKGMKKGAVEGFGNGIEYIRSGYSERDIGVKLDYHRVNYNNRAFQAYTETVFRLLGAQDQPFYYAARLRSLYGQAKASAINLGLKGKAAQKHVDMMIENPSEQMIKNAAKDAEATVFINETALGNIARGIQRLPGGEFVVPFGRTPSAVAMQVVNYSPVGIAKTIIENIPKGRFNQREFSQGIGRGITGTAALAIGVALYDSGLITLDLPKDEKERELWKLEGRQANSVLVDGKWRTVQSLGPAGNLLIIAGHFKRAFDEEGSPGAAMGRALSGSAKSFTEQTFMRGVNQFVDALSDPEISGPMMVGNTISSFVPTIVSDVARATDTKERRAESVGEKVMSRVPGARQTLEPKVTALGEEKELTANPIELMIDPTRPSKEISSPVISELRRLWDEGWEVSPNLMGDKAGYDVLSQQENTELWKRTGTITKDALEQLVSNELYKDLPDEKKSGYIEKVISTAQTAARTEVVAKKLTGLEGKELTDMIFKLRESGLASENIIPVALSKRNPKKVQKEKKE